MNSIFLVLCGLQERATMKIRQRQRDFHGGVAHVGTAALGRPSGAQLRRLEAL
ncbi:MAG TPA: hypothetical protein VKI40_09705 [Terriglobales bacterium]|jgi:hypothetical protein|nr:hypothetical protein [Terriglobales bacterium]